MLTKTIPARSLHAGKHTANKCLDRNRHYQLNKTNTTLKDITVSHLINSNGRIHTTFCHRSGLENYVLTKLFILPRETHTFICSTCATETCSGNCYSNDDDVNDDNIYNNQAQVTMTTNALVVSS